MSEESNSQPNANGMQPQAPAFPQGNAQGQQMPVNNMAQPQPAANGGSSAALLMGFLGLLIGIPVAFAVTMREMFIEYCKSLPKIVCAIGKSEAERNMALILIVSCVVCAAIGALLGAGKKKYKIK